MICRHVLRVVRVHTNDLAVDWGGDAGQSSGELEQDIVDHVVRKRAHVLPHKFQRADLSPWIAHEVNGEGIPRC